LTREPYAFAELRLRRIGVLSPQLLELLRD